jgi:hypothetical protein
MPPVTPRSLLAISLTSFSLFPVAAADWPSPYGPGREGSVPPADLTYSFASPIRAGSQGLGDLDSLIWHAGYVESLKQTETLHWLLGVDWRRSQFSVPDGAPIPTSLQSTALVLGADWQLADRWNLRGEWLPGVYSDFEDFSGRDFNAPFTLQIAYQLSDTLTVGGQVLVDVRRRSALVGTVGVTWRFAEDWRLVFWLPRPQVEYRIHEQLTAFMGASFTGGTYAVATDFGADRGAAELGGTLVDYQEVRVGGGLRWQAPGNWNVEVAGGWTLDRRFHFHQRDRLLNGDGAPYVQASFGRRF